MDIPLLDGRQQRERDFYETFSRRTATDQVRFDPVLGRERRPWNPYWYTYECIREWITSPAQRGLDFGCGQGISSIRLASLGCHVSGFDVCPNNIAIARRLAHKYGFDERTDFSVQAAEQTNYPSEHFDFVVGFGILHHVKIGPSISECLRVLKRNGKAVFLEHVEVPTLDRIRNTRLLTRLVPNGKSFSADRHITEDERKLSAGDLAVIRQLCPRLSIRRFSFLSRLDMFMRKPGDPSPSRLEKIDQRLFRVAPSLESLGASAVLILTKEQKGDESND